MDRSATFGTWKRYKLGQAQFTKWLKQTSDRIKGATSAGEPQKPPNSASNHGTAQLEAMVKIVVDKANPKDIPPSSIRILRDVVSLRKKSARFFGKVASRSEDDKLKKSNSSHEHMIKVLEKALVQLEAAGSKVTGKTSQPDSDGQVSMDDINNMFEFLKVEETQNAEDVQSEESEPEKHTKSSSKKKFGKSKGKKQKQKQKPKKEPKTQLTEPMSVDSNWVDEFKWMDDDGDDDEFDYYMLIYCFFEDFNSIRDYVVDKWCDYYFYQSVPIEVLGVITNAACEIFHEMESELFKTARALNLPARMVEYQFMMNTLFIQYGLNHVDYSNDKIMSEEDLQQKIHREADWLGFMTYTRLENILTNVPPGKVPMYPAGTLEPPVYGILDADGVAEFTNTIIFEMLPDFCLLKALKVNRQAPSVIGAQDEVTLDFEGALRARSYPSAMVLGLQLYVDIRYVLEGDTVKVFDQMQDTARQNEAALTRVYEHVQPSRLKREMWGRIAEMNCVMLEDFMEQDKIRRWKERGITDEKVEKHSLLKRHPIWSGLLSLRCRLVSNDLGHRIVSSSTAVLAAAFAYEAARLVARDFLPSWPSMDGFIKYYGQDCVLLQGNLSGNMSAADLLKRFAEYDLTNTKIASLVGFDKPSKTQAAFYERYGVDTERSRQDMRYLQDIIKEKYSVNATILPPHLSNKPLAVINHNERDATEKTAEVAKSGTLDTSLKTAERFFEPQRVSPIRLLEVLGGATIDILDNQLSVNYLQLYEESIVLLEAISEKFPEITENCGLPQVEDSTYVDKLGKVLVGLATSMGHNPHDGQAEQLVDGIKEFLVGLSDSDTPNLQISSEYETQY
ncbi:hypothetical protein BKA67DRAFT_542596 [Truncatella angustata]|uniref:DUF6604 domain-containing protein n=1 Tax=Truncatella angustata TaxID=152316 RepID=A0A9P8UAU2_9PEZI|nr:uncharacterized protein BKA67DRAFT_542596 [Truncatella angustata]KAH6640071.1 hypothetical protein BKA67DRAFT_542596 [Truncatella angustata]KAH8193835.1 hypothetical protein TruAng_011998 [Truncatella angustata]